MYGSTSYQALPRNQSQEGVLTVDQRSQSELFDANGGVSRSLPASGEPLSRSRTTARAPAPFQPLTSGTAHGAMPLRGGGRNARGRYHTSAWTESAERATDRTASGSSAGHSSFGILRRRSSHTAAASQDGGSLGLGGGLDGRDPASGLMAGLRKTLSLSGIGGSSGGGSSSTAGGGGGTAAGMVSSGRSSSRQQQARALRFLGGSPPSTLPGADDVATPATSVGASSDGYAIGTLMDHIDDNADDAAVRGSANDCGADGGALPFEAVNEFAATPRGTGAPGASGSSGLGDLLRKDSLRSDAAQRPPSAEQPRAAPSALLLSVDGVDDGAAPTPAPPGGVAPPNPPRSEPFAFAAPTAAATALDDDDDGKLPPTLPLWSRAARAAPALAIATLLNLLDAIPFGLALFGCGRACAPDALAAFGVPLFVLSTAMGQVRAATHLDASISVRHLDACRRIAFLHSAPRVPPPPRCRLARSTVRRQLGLALTSGFGCALSSVIVENLPFQHAIAEGIVAALPAGVDDPAAAPTLLAALALASLILSVVFAALSALKLGHVMHLFPRHILLGCIGGIGLFLIKSGLEVCGGRGCRSSHDEGRRRVGWFAAAGGVTPFG